MSCVIYADASVFLVVTGAAHSRDITPADAISPATGLTFRHASPHGAVDLAIAAPSNLVAYADLSTAAILKPVCLPVQITELRRGLVRCALREDPAAQWLSQRILAAIATNRHPASAGVFPTNRKEKS